MNAIIRAYRVRTILTRDCGWPVAFAAAFVARLELVQSSAGRCSAAHAVFRRLGATQRQTRRWLVAVGYVERDLCPCGAELDARRFVVVRNDVGYCSVRCSDPIAKRPEAAHA